MHFSLRLAFVCSLALAVIGGACGDDSPSTGGAGGSSGSGGSAGSGGSGGGSGGSGGAPAATGPSWTTDVKPILASKCNPCHTQIRTKHNLGSSYVDAKKTPENTSACGSATTIGACVIVRIKDGSMPAGYGCTGNPTTDAGKSVCLTKEQQDTIQAWVDGGLRE